MNDPVLKLNLLVRSELALARIQTRRALSRFILSITALLFILLAGAMLNFAIYHAFAANFSPALSGVFVALNMPKKGFWASVCLVLMSLPLLIPWNVVGTIWQVFGRVDIGQGDITVGNFSQQAFDLRPGAPQADHGTRLFLAHTHGLPAPVGKT